MQLGLLSTFETEVNEIHAYADARSNRSVMDYNTLEIGCDLSLLKIKEYFIAVASLLAFQNQQLDVVILAKQFNNSKATVRFAMARNKSEKMI